MTMAPTANKPALHAQGCLLQAPATAPWLSMFTLHGHARAHSHPATRGYSPQGVHRHGYPAQLGSQVATVRQLGRPSRSCTATPHISRATCSCAWTARRLRVRCREQKLLIQAEAAGHGEEFVSACSSHTCSGSATPLASSRASEVTTTAAPTVLYLYDRAVFESALLLLLTWTRGMRPRELPPCRGYSYK
jgi:hypothetical protein